MDGAADLDSRGHRYRQNNLNPVPRDGGRCMILWHAGCIRHLQAYRVRRVRNGQKRKMYPLPPLDLYYIRVNACDVREFSCSA